MRGTYLCGCFERDRARESKRKRARAKERERESVCVRALVPKCTCLYIRNKGFAPRYSSSWVSSWANKGFAPRYTSLVLNIHAWDRERTCMHTYVLEFVGEFVGEQQDI